MKSLFPKVLITGIVSILGLLAFASTKSLVPQDNAPPGNSLKWHADKAKKEGKQKVVVPSGRVDYLGSEPQEIDETLSDYTIVVARPVTKRAYQRDGDSIMTWYKFTIVQALTEFRQPPCPSCLSLNPPADLPIDYANEFLVPRNGGTSVIDGVNVQQVESGFPEFQENQDYVLFLLVYPNRVAVPAGGPLGVFAINNGDKLVSFSQHPDKIKDGVKSKFDNSLARLKKYLNVK